MADGFLAKKIAMTQIFGENGESIPVTVLEAGPCFVIREKTIEKDGYTSVCIGFDQVKPRRLTKPVRGYLDKHKIPAVRYIREIKPQNPEKFEVGKRIVAEDIFSPGDIVSVVGTSKGKGFAGVMKRWGFKGGPATHGSMSHRSPGSIGQSSSPSRVFPGVKMPGRMGDDRVTVRNLKVIKVPQGENTLLIKGAVPGSRGSLVLVQKTEKKKQAD